MELHWSHASSGKHGAAGEGFSIRDSRTITQILERNPEDDFECTYFRQRANRTPTKAKKGGGLFPMTISYTLPSELSDGYTDSESESDNTSNVERWLESLPANDAWSSAPNYSALDGSKGLEGVDEIQEDSKKSSEDDSGTFPNSTSDSRRNLISETGISKVRVTGDDFAKHTSIRRDEISVTTEWLDGKASQKKMKRTLKTRQKIPLWSKVEREATTVAEKEKLLQGKVIEKNNPFLLLIKTCGIPERNIPGDEKTAWSKSNALETRESRTAIEKPSAEEDGYDEMMQEMVNRLLTVSAGREYESISEQIVEKPKNESFLSMNSVEDSKKLWNSKESEVSFDSSLSSLAMKRARFSAKFKKRSPKLVKTKMNENQLSECKKNALKTKIQTQNSKQMRKISYGKNPSVTKKQPKLTQKSRHAITSQSFVENLNPGKNKARLRTVRFQDEVTTQTSSESWRQVAMAKAARNKQILQTVEQIVDDIQSEGLQYRKEIVCAEPGGVQRVSQNLISELAPGDAIELKECGSWRNNRKRPMHLSENKTIRSRKPMFTNPFVENCLDKAMDFALSKYKRPQNTWADFNKEKLRENMLSAAYEPPAKKLKPKSFAYKLGNMERQDFSLFNSWQAVHDYFLLYSSCK